MKRLVSISDPDSILPAYRNTAVGLLLEYHNLGRALDVFTKAQLLIGMCMSEAKRLRLRYPKILVAPLIYRVEDNLLYLVDES